MKLPLALRLSFYVLITISSSLTKAEYSAEIINNCKTICVGSGALEEVDFCDFCLSRNLVPAATPTPTPTSSTSDQSSGNAGLAWLYGILSVAIIAFAGFVSVILIPRFPESILNSVLQFLIAMGVGTLTGDALLHLLPHSFMGHGHGHGGGGSHGHDRSHGGHGHSHSKPASEEDEHTVMIWKGALALAVLIFFFFAERLMNIIRDGRRYANRAPVNEDDSTESRRVHRCIPDEETPSIEATVSLKSPEDPMASVAFTSRHLATNHGHSHMHYLPVSSAGRISSLAWLLVAGDSLHKFADGLVIGSGFAYSVTDGLTTSIAVLFHEVPHELGDFAILIKTGMTVKQAIICNVISSSLSLLGVLVGLSVGSSEAANHWIFAGTAGMFFYIALVDIVPELTSGFGEARSPISRLALQLAGLLLGFGVMLLIALYEHDIRYMLEN